MRTLAEQWLQQGREQGIEQGTAKGALIGQIQILEELLSEPVRELAQLRTWDQSQLEQFAQQLRRELVHQTLSWIA